MPIVSCPHCGVPNEAGSAFCGSCGKALPTAISAGPRVITGGALASTAAGAKLQADLLHKEAMKAANALLTVAIIQTALGAILYAILAKSPVAAAVNLPLVFGPILGVAILFWGLYIWARSNPLPAAIVGLVVYVTLWALDLIVTLVAIAHSPTAPNGSGGSGGLPAGGLSNGIFIKILIIAMLVRAIKAGVMHRKLMRQQAIGLVPVA